MQVKTTQGYHFLPIKFAKIQFKSCTTCSVINSGIRHFNALLARNQNGTTLWEALQQILSKLKIHWLFYSAISLLRFIFYSCT